MIDHSPKGSALRQGSWTLIMAIFIACQLGACVMGTGVARAKAPELPGVDLKDLDVDETKIFMEVLEQQFDPCGKPRSFLDAVQNPHGCAIATKLANWVVGRVARGENKRQIVRGLMVELRRLTVRHKFTVEGRPWVGSKNPRVTVIEFYDFQCPHCRLVAPKAREIVKSKKGVRLVYKQFPLEFHKAATTAAIAAVAAHMQGKFESLHDLLFEKQDSLDDKLIDKLIGKAGLKMKRFAKDMKKAREIVQADVKEGDAAGIEGTPSFFVNGMLVEFDALEEQIDAALKGE